MKLTIDWSQVPSEFKWAAMDADGKVWIYTNKPNKEQRRFMPTNGDVPGLVAPRMYQSNWRDSLTERPTEEPKVEQLEQPSAKPHKHAALIAEWIKDTNRVVEVYEPVHECWEPRSNPVWFPDRQYRFADTVKPEVTSPLSDDEIYAVWAKTDRSCHVRSLAPIAITAKIATLKEVAAMPSETTLLERDLLDIYMDDELYDGTLVDVANAAIAEFQKSLLKQLGE